MPITIISLEQAKPKSFNARGPSPVYQTKTYNEMAILIREDAVAHPLCVEFSPDELTKLNLKKPYPALKYCLQKIASKYARKDLRFCCKDNFLTVYRNSQESQPANFQA